MGSVLDKYTGEWKINVLGMARLYKDIEFARIMLNKFDKEGEFAFIKQQLEWIGLSDTFNVDNIICDVADDEEIIGLEEFLTNAYENDIRFNKGDFIKKIESIIKLKLGNNLNDILTKLDGSNKRNKGLRQYNKLFTLLELPYIVSSKKFKVKNKLYTKWIISIQE